MTMTTHDAGAARTAMGGLAEAMSGLTRPLVEIIEATLPTALGAVAAAAGAVATWRRMRQTERVLERLDDHMLRDIGLQRGDIEAVAYHLATRGTLLR